MRVRACVYKRVSTLLLRHRLDIDLNSDSDIDSDFDSDFDSDWDGGIRLGPGLGAPPPSAGTIFTASSSPVRLLCTCGPRARETNGFQDKEA